MKKRFGFSKISFPPIDPGVYIVENQTHIREGVERIFSTLTINGTLIIDGKLTFI